MYVKKFILVALVTCVFLTGCSLLGGIVYHPVVNQGNYVTQNAVSQLQLGQTKEQVTYLMGSPMLRSVFKNDTWYYVFREQPTYHHVMQETYSLTFDTHNKLTDIKKGGVSHRKTY